MEDFTTTWNHEELKAYILLYCAHADFNVSKEEKEYIKSRVGEEKYLKIRKEFEEDNDYQQIQKINAAIERFEYSKQEIDEAFHSIKKLFLIDGEMDILEQNLYRGLKHLLKKE
ncbi:hypothetical protein QRD02_11700 [Aequorivita sp. SDUM287046]|uniref:TerB family tellurite resistance protein n=1 Tax=Aequorivita aurantiaca TaxID=3053356 RepID=A0ABT8DMD6_9FLAO|nr:hypothetical protein [Aequorivita aurantiaca]MDN3725050.1 hypothetical protein [Aequorivita aurantiaca]